MTTSELAVERGGGKVFADLGHPEAGHLLGLSQPDVSRLQSGDFREYPLERVFRLLTALARDIVIRQPRSATGGKLRIAAEGGV